MEVERWRPVVGWEGLYEVSDLGRVRRGRRVLKQGTSRYRLVCLSRNGKTMTKNVHTLVLEAFVGLAPAGCEVRHMNNDKTDNCLLNLRWGTRSENILDRADHGVYPFGQPAWQ